MKIQFDENVPLPLRRFLPDHEIYTIQGEGWIVLYNSERPQATTGWISSADVTFPALQTPYSLTIFSPHLVPKPAFPPCLIANQSATKC